MICRQSYKHLELHKKLDEKRKVIEGIEFAIYRNAHRRYNHSPSLICAFKRD